MIVVCSSFLDGEPSDLFEGLYALVIMIRVNSNHARRRRCPDAISGGVEWLEEEKEVAAHAEGSPPAIEFSSQCSIL